MSELETIAYLSTASRELTSGEIDGILADARKFNGENDISGVLFYSDGKFCQVIEGAPQAIACVFARIEAAQAHSEIEVLLREKLQSAVLLIGIWVSRRHQPALCRSWRKPIGRHPCPSRVRD